MARNLTQDDDALRYLLQTARTIALVGHSDKPDRDSYRVGAYLRSVGYTVIPVNPTVSAIDGHTVYPTLRDVPVKVDIVDVFRGLRHIPAIVDDTIAMGAPVVWMQLALAHDEAAATALAAGVAVVMDRCIKVEHARLGIGTVAD